MLDVKHNIKAVGILGLTEKRSKNSRCVAVPAVL